MDYDNYLLFLILFYLHYLHLFSPPSSTLSLSHFSSPFLPLFSQGYVDFDVNGTRVLDEFTVFQYQLERGSNFDRKLIGFLHLDDDTFRYSSNQSPALVWPGKGYEYGVCLLQRLLSDQAGCSLHKYMYYTCRVAYLCPNLKCLLHYSIATILIVIIISE